MGDQDAAQDVKAEQETARGKAVNPWFSMWTRPRATVQHIADTDPDPETKLWLLAALGGYSNALDRASSRNMGDTITEWPLIFVFAAFAGPIIGILGMYIAGALLRGTGSWIGGRGSAADIRIAIAWSNVPTVWALLLWVPMLALFGKELFTSATPIIDASPSLVLLLFGFGLIEIVIMVWSVVVFLKSLGQMQGFSAWRAIANVGLAVLVIAVPLVAIIITTLIVFGS